MRIAMAVVAAAVATSLISGPAEAIPQWTSPDHHRVLLTVNPRSVTRKNSPATVDIDLAQALASLRCFGI